MKYRRASRTSREGTWRILRNAGIIPILFILMALVAIGVGLALGLRMI